MEAARTKLTRVLSRTFINNVKDKAQRVMGSGSSFKGLAKYSTSAATVVKDYEDYRKSLYGDITHKALLVDAVGTLVVPSQPMAQVLMCRAVFFFLLLWFLFLGLECLCCVDCVLLWVFQVVVLVLKFCFFISGLVDMLGFEFCSWLVNLFSWLSQKDSGWCFESLLIISEISF